MKVKARAEVYSSLMICDSHRLRVLNYAPNKPPAAYFISVKKTQENFLTGEGMKGLSVFLKRVVIAEQSFAVPF